MFCQKCGKDLGADYAGAFCPQCGVNLKAEKEQTAESSKNRRKYLLFAIPILLVMVLVIGVTQIGKGKTKKAGVLVVPEGTIRIEAERFKGNLKLTDIIIPEGVEYIGDEAFSGCANLTSVTIPKGVQEIGGGAFSGCVNLKKVIIPGSIQKMEDVSVPSGSGFLRRVGVFSDCIGLTSVTILDGVQEIGEYAFMRCLSLVDVKVPNSVQKIGKDAFLACPAEERVMRNREYNID